MSIRIKNQNGVIVNNVDGDQVIHGGQHGMVVTSEDVRGAIRDLRGALAGAALDGATAAQARAHVAEIDAAVHAPEPDKRRAAGPLKRLVELLADAGSLATAGAALIGPLQTLAGWLGVHGAAILGLLALPAPARPVRPLAANRVHRKPDCGGRMTGDCHVRS